MLSVRVAEMEEWWGGAQSGVWTIIPVTLADGQQEPTDRPKIGPSVTQIATCRVDSGPVVLVHAHFPKLALDEWRALAIALLAKFNDAPVVVVMEVSTGRLRVDTSFCCRDEAQLAASFAAAAVVQASWAWDESAEIRVESALQFADVEARFDGKCWRATIVRQGLLVSQS